MENEHMSLSYEELHTEMRRAADAASRALRPGDDVNNLSQASAHLRSVVEMLDDVDIDTPEAATPDAVLSRAEAIADEVHGRAIDLTSDADDELEALAEAVEASIKAGYIGEVPQLEWF